MRVLGVDFGLRRLGLAAGDTEGGVATPLRVLRIGSVRDAPAAVAAAARAEGAEAVVVGVPLGLEGEERRPEVRRVERFARALRRETGLPVHLVDESFSTREAGSGGPRDRGADDASHAAAAAVILTRWFGRPGRESAGSRT
jgi:putative Holliday junction resolvase